jgi:hypothetical protein
MNSAQNKVYLDMRGVSYRRMLDRSNPDHELTAATGRAYTYVQYVYAESQEVRLLRYTGNTLESLSIHSRSL